MHSQKNSKPIRQVSQKVVLHFYRIKVKLGHVGNNKYLPMDLPIKALDLPRALEKARNHGGVKHDHPNWCLEIPEEITFQAYKELEKKTYRDVYWEGHTRNQLASFADRLMDEEDLLDRKIDLKKKHLMQERKKQNKKQFLQRKNRLEDQYWAYVDQEAEFEVSDLQ